MTTPVALLWLWVGLVLDRGLEPLFDAEPGGVRIAVDVLLIAAVWVAIRSRSHVSAAGASLSNHAEIRPAGALLWTGLAGAAADLVAGLGYIGPRTLGLMAASALVLVARRGLNARSAPGLAAALTLAGVLAGVVSAGLYAARSLLTDAGGPRAVPHLLDSVASACVTAATAAVVAFLIARFRR